MINRANFLHVAGSDGAGERRRQRAALPPISALDAIVLNRARSGDLSHPFAEWLDLVPRIGERGFKESLDDPRL